VGKIRTEGGNGTKNLKIVFLADCVAENFSNIRIPVSQGINHDDLSKLRNCSVSSYELVLKGTVPRESCVN